MMERILSQMFDQQRFQQNSRLAKVIGSVEERYANTLTDDDLEMVSAAGKVVNDEDAVWSEPPVDIGIQVMVENPGKGGTP